MIIDSCQKDTKSSLAQPLKSMPQQDKPSITIKTIPNNFDSSLTSERFICSSKKSNIQSLIHSKGDTRRPILPLFKIYSSKTCDTQKEFNLLSSQNCTKINGRNRKKARLTAFSLIQIQSQNYINNSSLKTIENYLDQVKQKNSTQTNESHSNNHLESKEQGFDCIKEDEQKIQYFNQENYSFRRLSHQHRTQALKLLTKSFIEEQPLAKAYYKQFPEEKEGAYAFWEEYWDMYMDDAIEGGVSLVIVDLANNEEVIGVYTFKNFNYVPDNPQLDEKYLRGFNLLSSQVMLEEELIQNSSSEIQDILLSSESIAEAWAAAIKVGHTGKKLYSKMTALAEKVLREAGFQNALVFASNFLSSKVVKKLDFTEAAELEVTQFEHLEHRPFAEIQELHKSPSLWFKTLQ